ncbi:hypothetical protein TNCT_385931 [Trichonephila clavata]|uniref:Uncharacterized protein n=1 Tax=Trichonephila clavata TaxID=2740835 RepID=A0A8X6FUE9_TRICU|nr:hypothetical protein TNCT_385931 [Trichonephila clavata]
MGTIGDRPCKFKPHHYTNTSPTAYPHDGSSMHQDSSHDLKMPDTNSRPCQLLYRENDELNVRKVKKNIIALCMTNQEYKGEGINHDHVKPNKQ